MDVCSFDPDLSSHNDSSGPTLEDFNCGRDAQGAVSAEESNAGHTQLGFAHVSPSHLAELKSMHQPTWQHLHNTHACSLLDELQGKANAHQSWLAALHHEGQEAVAGKVVALELKAAADIRTSADKPQDEQAALNQFDKIAAKNHVTRDDDVEAARDQIENAYAVREDAFDKLEKAKAQLHAAEREWHAKQQAADGYKHFVTAASTFLGILAVLTTVITAGAAATVVAGVGAAVAAGAGSLGTDAMDKEADAAKDIFEDAKDAVDGAKQAMAEADQDIVEATEQGSKAIQEAVQERRLIFGLAALFILIALAGLAGFRYKHKQSRQQHFSPSSLGKGLRTRRRIRRRRQVEVGFKGMWADHGDDIGRQYAGTGALKSGFTRIGKRTLGGLIDDGVKSNVRYYLNNFKDGHKQDALNLISGSFKVKRDVTLQFRRQYSPALPIIVALVALGYALTSLNRVQALLETDSRSSSTGFTASMGSSPVSRGGLMVIGQHIVAPLLLACGLIALVQKNGRMLVDRPQLCPQLANTVGYADKQR